MMASEMSKCLNTKEERMDVLGIDIGGSGIKGAIVNVDDGAFISDRYRLPTPEGAKPKDVARVFASLVHHFDYKGVIGAGFPAVVHHGIMYSAANVDQDWIGTNASDLFSETTGCDVHVLNDADAAGIAEMTFGAGKDYPKGVVLLLTIGTGVGSAIFVDGVLFPNTEFGHLEIRGKDAEWRCSDAARQKKEYSWKAWAKRWQEYLDHMEKLLSPDVIIIGGGISKEADNFLPLLKTRAKILTAQLLNQAGIVGAALYAANKSETRV
jgi:polyphosphate glucokinase